MSSVDPMAAAIDWLDAYGVFLDSRYVRVGWCARMRVRRLKNDLWPRGDDRVLAASL